MSGVYDFEVKTIEGKLTTLKPYANKVLLVVNVASACGLTPQYKGLQELYSELKGRGFEVLGFPCNQFGAQEPGTEAEIKEFCSLRFDVSFPMFAKIDVNGPGTHPLYKYMKEKKSNKDDKADIEWNFAKFLIDRKGNVVERFHARTEPSEIKARIIEVLG
ncbi:MAG: glutathione peroxidase [Proteobacteria bacterium]|nr:glutathione peroxidase [Pseudomonadota bacterium]